MTTKEKIKCIDEAIEDILSSLKQGIEISEYWIDNVKVQKRSPLELITELRRIKKLTIADAQAKSAPTHKIYIFGDRY